MSTVHLQKYEFYTFRGSGLPSGEEQYFSMFGDRHSAVFMQSKAQFFWIFHRGAPGTMRVFKAGLIFGDDDDNTVPCPPSDEHVKQNVVWVVELKPVTVSHMSHQSHHNYHHGHHNLNRCLHPSPSASPQSHHRDSHHLSPLLF
jgi:hypothetical protein